MTRPRHPFLLRLLLTAGLVSILATTAFAHGGGGSLDTPADAQVVKVHVTDTEIITELRKQFDVWGIDRNDTDRRDDDSVILLTDTAGIQDLRDRGLVVENDVVRNAELVTLGRMIEGQTRGVPGLPCYRTVEETFADLAQLATDHPTLARWIDIGDTWEKINAPAPGYDIFALVLGNQNTPGPKAQYVIQAAMHAREMATAELATRFAEQLLADYGTDPDATWILDHTNVHIVPQLNPDGRKEAEDGQFWRKNKNNDFCSNSDNRGIDLNRNSSTLWGGSGSSGSSCNETFRGPSAGSEPETQAIEAYLDQVFDDQRGPGMNDPAPANTTGLFISIHSFSELVLYPWEATFTNAPNSTGLQTLGRKFGFFTDYGVCQDCLGVAAGTTPDQAYGVYGVAAYTFEIGTTFFQSCTSFENTILPDNLPALLYGAKAARRPYETPSGPEVINVDIPTLSDLPVVTVTRGSSVTVNATADDTRFDSNGNGNEPVQPISAAYVTIDEAPWQTGDWTPMNAVDGTFNQNVEDVTVELDTGGLTVGRHLIYVFAEDSSGAVGVPSAIFLDIVGPGTIFADSFESGDTSLWSLTVQ
ncbi:MAG: M14 family zinc carboxypeptidase [Acidobacteriota bacterium]